MEVPELCHNSSIPTTPATLDSPVVNSTAWQNWKTTPRPTWRKFDGTPEWQMFDDDDEIRQQTLKWYSHKEDIYHSGEMYEQGTTYFNVADKVSEDMSELDFIVKHHIGQQAITAQLHFPKRDLKEILSWYDTESKYRKSVFWESMDPHPRTPVGKVLRRLEHFAESKRLEVQNDVESSVQLESQVLPALEAREQFHETFQKAWGIWATKCASSPKSNYFNTRKLTSKKTDDKYCELFNPEELRHTMLKDDAKLYYEHAATFVENAKLVSQESLSYANNLVARLQEAQKVDPRITYQEFKTLVGGITDKIEEKEVLLGSFYG